MIVEQLLEEVCKAGLTLGLTATGSIKVTPKELITPNIRELIKANKSALVTALDCPSTQPETPTTIVELERPLIDAAMRACDYWGDSDQARAEMIADLKASPQYLRQALLEHFLVAYGKAK
jgi:hypothetical protein